MSHWILALLLLAVPAGAGDQARQRLLELAEENPRLELTARRHQPSDGWYLAGHYRVFEDREARDGRELELNLVLLPAKD